MPFTKDNVPLKGNTGTSASQECASSSDVGILEQPAELAKATEKRKKCEVLAKSFRRLSRVEKASRIQDCGTQMVFAHIVAERRMKLHKANFCRERLCPMCAMRRSKQIYAQVSQVMDVVEREYPELTPVFLTLTVKNCKADELGATLDVIYKGWHRLINNGRMKRLLRGWFRALEVTYNQEEDTYHPHVHVVLLVPPSYFIVPRDYMTTEKWVKAWRKALRLDYDPVCDIRAVKKEKDARAGEVAEVAKYTVKDTDYIKDDESLTDKLVDVFSRAVKGRRLYAFGGLMKDVAKQLRLDDKEAFQPGEVKDKNGVILRRDIDYVLVLYRWNIGLSVYEKSEFG
jgi:plasmid rolling circle replication initiator protein Rep